MLPTNKKYRTLKVQVFPELPYWYKINMDAIDGTSFKTLELTTTHGDIEVKVCTRLFVSNGQLRHPFNSLAPFLRV